VGEPEIEKGPVNVFPGGRRGMDAEAGAVSEARMVELRAHHQYDVLLNEGDIT